MTSHVGETFTTTVSSSHPHLKTKPMKTFPALLT
jgi:hypothetical protein